MQGAGEDGLVLEWALMKVSAKKAEGMRPMPSRDLASHDVSTRSGLSWLNRMPLQGMNHRPRRSLRPFSRRKTLVAAHELRGWNFVSLFCGGGAVPNISEEIAG